jgi:hypothetical protein
MKISGHIFVLLGLVLSFVKGEDVDLDSMTQEELREYWMK